MLVGARRAEEPDQGRLEARDRLRPDEGCDRRADDPDREPEPDRDLLGLRPAGSRRDPVDQERRHQARRDHPGRLRRVPDEVAAIKAGNETGSVAQFPAKIGSLGIATLYKAVLGKKVPKNVDTGTAFVTKANAGKFG